MNAPLVEYLLQLADDRLVLGHRLSEWCGHGPMLEEDIALTNVALDLIGHANLLLERAGALEGQGRSADDLAYFRNITDFRNCLLVEQSNGDFAATTMRSYLFDVYDVALLGALEQSTDSWLAELATKAGKESAYHLRHSRDWVIRLGDGTDESHARTQRALDDLWLFTGELFEVDSALEDLVADGTAADGSALHPLWRADVESTARSAGLAIPEEPTARLGGRRGVHGEGLGSMLDEMQSLARAHPGATW